MIAARRRVAVIASGTPALRRPSRTGSSPARYVGSSLIAVQRARAREMVKVGLSARPALTAERASSSRPSCASAAANAKMGMRIISVGLDRPSKPRDRLLLTAEVVLRHARESHPGVSHRIARAEAQGLDNVSLCFFGATDENLAKPDSGMGVGEISIQRQRMFTFGDALRGALGVYVDISQASYGRAHGPGPRTRLWSTSLRPRRRPPRDRSQREVRPRSRPRAPIQRARRHCRDRRRARDRKSCALAPHVSGVIPLLNQARP